MHNHPYNLYFSYLPIDTLIGLLGLIKNLLLFSVTYLYFSEKFQHFQRLIKFISLAVLILCFSIFLEKIFINNLHRISGLFFSEQVAGSYLLKFGLIIIFFHFFNKENLKFLIFILLIFISILLTGDRAPFINFVAFIFLFLLFIKIDLKEKFKIFLPLFIIFILTITFSKQLQNRYNLTLAQFGMIKNFEQNELLKNYENDYGNYKNFTDSRWFDHFRVAYRIAKNNIFVGSGLKTFRTICRYDEFDEKNISNNIIEKNSRCNTHPHNIYFEILSETGLFGLLIFLFFLYKLFKKNWKHSNYEKKIIFLISIFIFFSPFQTTGAFFSTFNGFFYFFYFALLMSNQIFKIENK